MELIQKTLEEEPDNMHALFMIDVDNFKALNDTHGHQEGDRFLINFAAEIRNCFTDGDIIGRIGGDEFLVILQNRDLADRDELFARFEAECEVSFVDENNVKLPISIARGFAAFDPSKDTKFEDVFARADNEMYKNKRNMKIPAI